MPPRTGTARAARSSRSRRRRVRSVHGVDEIDEAVEHPRGEGAAERIPGDQLDVHGAERGRNLNRADDRPVRRRSQTRMIPRSSGSPGTTFSELAGIMKSDVTIRLRSGRAEMPCGLKSCVGGSAGHSATSCRLASNSATRPGVPPVVGAHLRHQESAFLQRQEVVGDVGERAARREQESRLAGFDTSKKKMLF